MSLAPRRVLVVSGPNLQLLGKRQPALYGSTTLPEIHARLEEVARMRRAEVVCRQTNHEGEIVDIIGDSRTQGVVGMVINPGAYTHTSFAIFDAITAVELPTVEVHLTNLQAREAFRRRSRIAPACIGQVSGFGALSYELGLVALLDHLDAKR